MKRKPASAEVVDQVILRGAKAALVSDQLKRPVKCEVCGSDCAPNAAENLCWVCRRLKISAWKDVDQQMSAQE